MENRVTNRQALTALRSSQGTLEKYCLRVDAPRIQINRLVRSMNKIKKRINRLITKKHAFDTTSLERREIEKMLPKLEAYYQWKLIRLEFLKQAVQIQEKRIQSRLDNEMERARIVRERINRTKPRKARDTSLSSEKSYHPENKDTIQTARRYKKKKIVTNSKGGKSVKDAGKYKLFDKT